MIRRKAMYRIIEEQHPRSAGRVLKLFRLMRAEVAAAAESLPADGPEPRPVVVTGTPILRLRYHADKTCCRFAR